MNNADVITARPFNDTPNCKQTDAPSSIAFNNTPANAQQAIL